MLKAWTRTLWTLAILAWIVVLVMVGLNVDMNTLLSVFFIALALQGVAMVGSLWKQL